jgi:hypothetical protein
MNSKKNNTLKEKNNVLEKKEEQLKYSKEFPFTPKEINYLLDLLNIDERREQKILEAKKMIIAGELARKYCDCISERSKLLEIPEKDTFPYCEDKVFARKGLVRHRWDCSRKEPVLLPTTGSEEILGKKKYFMKLKDMGKKKDKKQGKPKE